jgi:hypothetical protein
VAAAGGDAAGAQAAPNKLTNATIRAADDHKRAFIPHAPFFVPYASKRLRNRFDEPNRS